MHLPSPILLPLSMPTEKPTTTQRLRAFGKRAIGTLQQEDQSPFHDRWNAYVGLRIARHMSRKALEQFNIALSEDLIPVLVERAPARLEEDKRTAFFAGSRDLLTPLYEMEAAKEIIGSDLDLFELDASHRSMATRRGAEDLQAAVDYLTKPTKNS